MSWLRVHLRADCGQAENVSDALEQCGALAVTLEDAGDQPLFAGPGTEEPRLWAHTCLSALLPEDMEPSRFVAEVAALLGLDAPPAWESDSLPDQDWERAWMDRFTAMRFGINLWVSPSWLEPPAAPAVVVTLDPGLAFGTGTHATTALCLEWLAAGTRAQMDVLDFGCGSGILAIAALKLGARSAWAVDIDGGALSVTRENAQRNAVLDRIRIADPGSLPPDIDADIVVANILADPLVELAPRLRGLTRAGGILLLSGMLSGQVREIEQHYARYFDIEARVRDGWAMLVCRKFPRDC